MWVVLKKMNGNAHYEKLCLAFRWSCTKINFSFSAVFFYTYFDGSVHSCIPSLSFTCGYSVCLFAVGFGSSPVADGPLGACPLAIALSACLQEMDWGLLVEDGG